MLGLPTTLPIWIAPAALARLGHPDGEMNLTRAAGAEGILQGVRTQYRAHITIRSQLIQLSLQQISSNASCSLSEITSVLLPTQPLIFQLYVNRDRSATVEHLQKVRQAVGPSASSAFKALFVTVDAAVAGKRELDQRAKGDFSGPAMGGKDNEGAGAGVALVSWCSDCGPGCERLYS